MLKGVFTALATPFTAQGQVDIPALTHLVRAQLKAGVDGLVVLGTTAETPTLSEEEKKQILDTCTPLLQGKANLIIGAGTNSTSSTLANLQALPPYHPQAALVVTPYYNKPNPAGLIAHFQAAATAGIALILYHVPGRTGLKIAPAVLDKLLAQVPQIVGIKECDYDMAQVTQTAVKYAGKLSFLCGNDDLLPEFLAIGACGTISAAANVLAPAIVKIYRLFQAGQTQEAFAVFAQVYPLIKACYAETNPTCIKYMLEKLGFGTQTIRAPLGEISAENKSHIDNLLATTAREFLI